MPDGKPRQFSVRDDVPACPPVATPSTTTVSSPSDAP
jgi:hypothetical protein